MSRYVLFVPHILLKVLPQTCSNLMPSITVLYVFMYVYYMYVYKISYNQITSFTSRFFWWRGVCELKVITYN